MSDASGTPPGWYPDPQGGDGQRYWNGQEWTDLVDPAPAGGPQPGQEPGQPQVGVPPAAGGRQVGSVGVRFGARFVDGLVYGLPLVIVLSVIGLGPTSGAGGQVVYGIVSALVGVGYFTYLESSSGQTLGKKVFNLTTVGPDGGPPTQEQAFRRNAWYLLGVIPFIGGLASLAVVIWIAVQISNTGRGPHDEWGGGTVVVRTA